MSRTARILDLIPTLLLTIAAVAAGVKGDFLLAAGWVIAAMLLLVLDELRDIRKALNAKHYTVNVTNPGSLTPERLAFVLREAERRPTS